uniref:Transmembrane protein n=1 Tax=Chromera velia CCMP2878 TaxID=1169474 RepID=A0A0G4HZS0_9ALVE|eukprot:Cvel_9788.t1-p1 / transcript=Cvel_9788.t1 / gene=Cvel_9788 / organism=Chromera_velia_CCMP2878 / gene_product=hypothetical protein / transcript_product=hypothetical protein / location=Cvel_scaffold574:30028-33131(+) / protein_length=960 / sequence_SO=supercontig / SO=protein_coding / is_pseudo=false
MHGGGLIDANAVEAGECKPDIEKRLSEPSLSSSVDSFARVCKRFRMRLAFNRRFLGIFRHTFDRETSIWVRLLSLHQDMTPVILSTLFLWASSLVSAPLASLRCEPLHPSLTERRLHLFPSISCHWPLRKNDPYSRWWGVSLGVLLAGVFGVPLLIASFMLLNSFHIIERQGKERVSARRNGKLREGGADERRADTGDGEESAGGALSGEQSLPATHHALMQSSGRMRLASFSRQFSLLLGGYREKVLFWELLIFARRLSIPLCLLAPSTSARYNILNVHAVLFLLLQTIVRPYRSSSLNWLETFSLTVWFFGVTVVKAVTDTTISLVVRVALVHLLLVSIGAFIIRCLAFIISDRLSTKQKGEGELCVWTCLPMSEKPCWKRVVETLWKLLLPALQRCRKSCRPCRSKGGGGTQYCKCGVRRQVVCVRLQKGGHALVPVKVLSRRAQGKRRTKMTDASRMTRHSASLKLPTVSVDTQVGDESDASKLCLSLNTSERRTFDSCFRPLCKTLEGVNITLNSERNSRGGRKKGSVFGEKGHCGFWGEAFRSSPHDLRQLPFLLSFCFRLGVLCDASMNQGQAKEDNDKRFIAFSCEETAEHCAIVRELLSVPHPGSPLISRDSGHGLTGQPNVFSPGIGRPAGDVGEHSVSASRPSQACNREGIGEEESDRPYSPAREGAIEADASASLSVASRVEESKRGGESDCQSESDASLSLNSLSLSDDPSLLAFAVRRMRAAHAVGEPLHEGADAAASAPVGVDQSAPAAIHQQKVIKGEEGREETGRPQMDEEKGRLNRGQTLSDKLLWKRRGEKHEGGEPTAGVGDSLRRKGGGSSDCGCGEDDQIVTQTQRQWTEEDAETADGALTDRLISFHHDVSTERPEGALVNSLEEWLREGSSEKERQCLWRMAAVGRAFFDSPSIESALRDKGIPLGDFQEKMELLLHLHPAQLLQVRIRAVAKVAS